MIFMKYVFYLLALLPFFLSAQEDKKYLEGAVPVEEGKVVFSRVFDAPSMNRQEVYETALQWANNRFDKTESEAESARVVFQNPSEGEIAAIGKEYIVFSSTFLSLDRALMSYQVLIYCEDNACQIKLTNIRYEYNVAYQREPEKYIAEEWITDKYALRKGKLNRITGKFRRGTVDFADSLFASAAKAFGQQPAPAKRVQTVTPDTVPAAKLLPAMKGPEGFTRMEAGNIPTTLQRLLPASVLVIKMADNNISEKGAEWKGFGNLLGKQIASVAVPAEGNFGKYVKTGEVYTLQFASDGAVWMIIECSKQGETAEGDKLTVIGEVLNVWVK